MGQSVEFTGASQTLEFYIEVLKLISVRIWLPQIEN